jgi:hypothetical protein
LLGFFISIANPKGGYVVPVEVKVPVIVLGQKLGVTTQAGIVSSVELAIKYVRLI